MKRNCDWMQTYTGKVFYPFDARPEDIDINDITHALSMQCRYAGHTKLFYSVAEHSVYVSRIFDDYSKRVALAALLHDSAEAYLVDLPRPVKARMLQYQLYENALLAVIYEKFGIEISDNQLDMIKMADKAILATEAKQIMVWPPPKDWELAEKPMDIEIKCLAPYMAKVLFLERFNELT